MTHEQLQQWLDAYKEAWENRDVDAAVNLFADNATYQETPYDSLLKGRRDIQDYWARVPKEQDQVRFTYEALYAGPDQGIARWWGSFNRIPSGSHVELDGVLIVKLDAQGKCSYFREWWHRRETEKGVII